MNITIENNRFSDDTAVFRVIKEGIQVGDCLVSFFDGTKEDLLEKEARNELGSAYLALVRMKEKEEIIIQQKIAFIVLFQMEETWQRKGIGRQALSLILTELEKESDVALLNAYNGGFLIPFYETVGFKRLSPYEEEHYMWRKNKKAGN